MDPEIQLIHPAALMMSGFDTAGPSDHIYAVLYLESMNLIEYITLIVFTLRPEFLRQFSLLSVFL